METKDCPEDAIKALQDLEDENERLRYLIREMAKHGDFVPLAVVEVTATSEPIGVRLLVCTGSGRTEESIAKACGDVIADVMKLGRPKRMTAGETGEKDSET